MDTLKRFRRSLSGKDGDHEERLARLEGKNLQYTVRARLVNAGGVISLRKHCYREAEQKNAFYSEEEEGIRRQENDLLIFLVFISYEFALAFESALHQVCGEMCSIGVSRRTIKVKRFSGRVRVDEDGDPVRVFRHDYDEAQTDSPDGTASQSEAASSVVASNFSSSREIVRYQSIEKPEYVSGGEAEKCHIVPKCDLETEEEKKDENDMLSMSGNYHKLYDGNKKVVPKMRLSVVNGEGLETTQQVPPGRHLVWIQVDFSMEWVGQAYGGFLKAGSKRVSDTKFYTWVCVENRQDFANNMRIKYDITSKRWANGK